VGGLDPVIGEVGIGAVQNIAQCESDILGRMNEDQPLGLNHGTLEKMARVGKIGEAVMVMGSRNKRTGEVIGPRMIGADDRLSPMPTIAFQQRRGTVATGVDERAQTEIELPDDHDRNTAAIPRQKVSGFEAFDREPRELRSLTEQRGTLVFEPLLIDVVRCGIAHRPVGMAPASVRIGLTEPADEIDLKLLVHWRA
jgi:hypothetical protein